jgi:hypothetical protein
MNLDLWEEPILFAEDSPAKTYLAQESRKDLLGSEAVCSGTHSLSRRMSKQNGSCWKMSQDFFAATRVATSEQSSLHWPTQGIATSNGEFWIRSSSESRNAADACSLRDVLEETVADRYLLSESARYKIIERSTRKDKELPPDLYQALMGDK